jgi:hypothetical protein
MKNPIHSPGSTRKNNIRRGNVGENTASANPNAQENKEWKKQVDSGIKCIGTQKGHKVTNETAETR